MRLLKLEVKPKEKKYAIDPEMAMAAKCTAWQLSYRGNPVYTMVNLAQEMHILQIFEEHSTVNTKV